MPQTEAERITANEQRHIAVAADLTEIRRLQRAHEVQLGKLEDDVRDLMTAHHNAQRAEERRTARVVLWLQVLSVAVGIGGLVMSSALVALAIHFG